MSVAGLNSVVVEVEFVAGTWTDVSSYVRFSAGLKGQYGRASEYGDVSASTFDLQLRNEDGRFTSDNPLSPYWPNIVENKRIRVSGTRSSTTYRFFTGYVAGWDPTFPTADSTSGAVVEVSAVDILGQLDRHELEAEYVEQALALARTASTWTDVYPLDDAATAVSMRNAGILTAPATKLGAATVIPTVTPRRGSATVQTGDDALALPGYLTLTPSGAAGPVLRVVPQAAVSRIDVWLRFPVTTLPAPGLPLRVMDVWVGDSYLVAVRLSNNAGSTDLEVISPGGTILATPDTGVNDNTWRKLTLASNAGTPTSLDVLLDDALISTSASYDLTTVTRFYLGGQCYPNLEGKQQHCTGMDLAGLVLTAGATSPAAEYARPTTSVAASTRFSDFLSYISGYYTGGGVQGSDDRQVWRSPTAGRTVLDCAQELARTVGGAVFASPSGAPSLLLPDMIGPTTPAATIDAELDADAQSQQPTWRRAVDSIPTRVTVASPAGAATVVNAAAEAAGGKRDLSISSCAASLTDAASLGYAMINAAPGLRLAQLAVDLVTAKNDLWSSLFWQPASSPPPMVAWFNRGAGLTAAPVSPTLAVGDLLVLWAYNGSSTLPTIGTSGWTTITTATSSGGALILAWKVATSTEVSAGQVPVTFNGSARVGLTHSLAAGKFNPANPFTLLAPYAISMADGTGPLAQTLSMQPGPVKVIGWFFATGTTATLTLNGASASYTSDNGVTEALTRLNGDDPTLNPTNPAWTHTASWAWDGVSRNSALGIVQVQFSDSSALRPGSRLRVTNLPSATFGVTYTDAIAQGWTLDLGVDRCVLTFDTTPADDPVRGVVGNSEYGRAGAEGMTVTGGTALGGTSNGTLVVTTAVGKAPLTVDPTAYPLDLNLNGERVTVTSAPASSTSPQTVTTTTRGVAPTVARAHSSGEPVDIWHAAQAAL